MSEPLTLMAVHAHPDDEAISTGGVLARYSAEGVRTVLVTCTRGEEGEIASPALATPENLAEVRVRELGEAVRLLKIGHLEILGYRDSGMMGAPANERPEAFYQADLDEATGRLVALIRKHKPQVLITYDDNGFYGHPDHIRAHQITVRAFEQAGDPNCYPELGMAPWAPSKLYYSAVPQGAFVEMRDRLLAQGLPDPWEGRDDVPPGTPDELIHAVIDVEPYIEAKHAALMAHRTQMDPNFFWVKMGPDVFKTIFVKETFTRAKSRVEAPEKEDDLFAGLRG